jgi:hypothetical protein
MASWCKTFRLGHVWLTAAMTLVAGLPHYSGLCPDGTLRLFCPAGASNPIGCCCGGSCCSPAGGSGARGGQESAPSCCGSTTEKSCCSAHGTLKPVGSSQRIQAHLSCCTRTLTTAQISALPRGSGSASQQETSHSVVFASPPDSFALLLAPSPAAKAWQIKSVPPPTDLVTLHQHLIL